MKEHSSRVRNGDPSPSSCCGLSLLVVTGAAADGLDSLSTPPAATLLWPSRMSDCSPSTPTRERHARSTPARAPIRPRFRVTVRGCFSSTRRLWWSPTATGAIRNRSGSTARWRHRSCLPTAIGSHSFAQARSTSATFVIPRPSESSPRPLRTRGTTTRSGRRAETRSSSVAGLNQEVPQLYTSRRRRRERMGSQRQWRSVSRERGLASRRSTDRDARSGRRCPRRIPLHRLNADGTDPGSSPRIAPTRVVPTARLVTRRPDARFSQLGHKPRRRRRR